MLQVIIFGFGIRGKKLIDQCIKYESGVNIVAITDNKAVIDQYANIPIIKPDKIKDYVYDEIWITTVWFKDIKAQLMQELHIPENKICYMESTMPILEYRIRKKYAETIEEDIYNYDKGMRDVLGYLKDHRARMFCYPFFDEYLNKENVVSYDPDVKLYYGIYEGHRMYLSRRYDAEQKAAAYFNTMTMEQDPRCPHCYWNDSEMLRVSGIGIDVGAAEGIFGLKIINQVEHLYLIEVDEDWIEALNYTYRDYLDKVTIIKKLIGRVDEGNCARIDSLFENKKISFLKMDIEGMEQEALEGAVKTLENNDVTCAICVYHHKEDNDRITNWFEAKNYMCHNSEGYAICYGEWELEKDDTDFRKTLLFARKGREK